MTALTLNPANSELTALLSKVRAQREPVVVSSGTDEPVVMMTMDNWTGWDETAYLMSSPANRKHLEESLEQHRAGKVVVKTMEELEEMERALK